MGDARAREMLEVKKTLDLTGLRVLKLPDGKLKELDPWAIEKVIREDHKPALGDLCDGLNDIE